MNNMYIADDQTRIVTVNMNGGTINSEDKVAFAATIHKVGEEASKAGEAAGITPRAEDLANQIADAMRTTFAERGLEGFTITVRPPDPTEEGGVEAAARHPDNSDAAPDQARVGVEFVNGTDNSVGSEASSLREVLASLVETMAETVGVSAVPQLDPARAMVGRMMCEKMVSEIIKPGLKLLANDDWYERAKEASPRGVQAMAMALTSTILEHDYCAEVLGMQDYEQCKSDGPATQLLRGLLMKAGEQLGQHDTGLHVLSSYLAVDGGQPEIVPWKDGAPVEKISRAFAYHIDRAAETVGMLGQQYQELADRAAEQGHDERFQRYAVKELGDDPDFSKGLMRLYTVIAWAALDKHSIQADARMAEADALAHNVQ